MCEKKEGLLFINICQGYAIRLRIIWGLSNPEKCRTFVQSSHWQAHGFDCAYRIKRGFTTNQAGAALCLFSAEGKVGASPPAQGGISNIIELYTPLYTNSRF